MKINDDLQVCRDWKDHLKSEVQVLLLCARVNPNREEVERLEKLLEHSVDWENVYQLAIYHRVFPLLYRNLKQHEIKEVPLKVAERLRRDFDSNQQRMMMLTAELLNLVAAFEAKGIVAVSVKGPVLAAQVYQNLALRPAGDLDILVKPDDVHSALEVLRESGYRVFLGNTETVITVRQERAIRRFHYHFGLVNPVKGTEVELHFSLLPEKFDLGPATEKVVDEANWCSIAGRQVPVLSDEENLIYLCVHGSKHAWLRLEWLVAVAEFLRLKETLRSEMIWKMAQERNAERALALGSALAERLMGVTAIPGTSRLLSSVPGLVRLVDEATLRLGEVTNIEGEREIAARFQWVLCGSVRRKVRWILHRKLQPQIGDFKHGYENSCLLVPFAFWRVLRRLLVGMIRKRRGEYSEP